MKDEPLNLNPILMKFLETNEHEIVYLLTPQGFIKGKMTSITNDYAIILNDVTLQIDAHLNKMNQLQLSVSHIIGWSKTEPKP